MQNVFQIEESALIVFGGMVCEVTPPDVPSGSACIATDCDFTVASAKTRDGLANVYSYAGNDQVEIAMGGASSGTGEAWTNPGNISQNTPGTYASVSLNKIETFVTIFEDNFATDPDQNPLLPGNWNQTSTPPLAVVSGVCQASAQAYCYQSWSGNAPDDCFAQFTFSTVPTLGTSAAVILRASQNSIVDGYKFVVGNATPNPFFSIGIGGVVLLSQSITISPGDIFTFACLGEYLYAYQNGTEIGNVQDSTYSAGGPGSIALGAYGRYAITNVQFTDFQAGGLTTSGNISQDLNATAFGFTIPSTSSITGVEVTVNGKQNTTSGETILSIVPITQNFTPTPRTFQLTTSDGSYSTGSPIDTWDEFWSTAQVNSSAWGFSIQASALDGTPVTFDISGVEVTVWYTPAGVAQFDYIKTFEMTDGSVLNLALDDTGVFWQEDAINDPDVLTQFYTAIEPDTFAVSVTQDDREFIALSDLSMGTDMPRGYNGQWLDRLSQVGPGSAPQVTFISTTYNVLTITQETPVSVSGMVIVWSNSAAVTGSGNVITIQAAPGNLADVIAAGVGATIILGSFASVHGISPDGTYQVIACGTVATAGFGPATPYFSVLSTSSNSADNGLSAGTYQLTQATMTTATPIPNLFPGGQFTVSGSSQAGYNSTWTVTNGLTASGAPIGNTSQMTITDTSLTSNIATYVYDLVEGAQPTVGEQVTITGTANGNGIFNVVNAIIYSVAPIGMTGGSFTLQIVSPNIASAAEVGNAIIAGTIFTFDPGVAIPNATGGALVIAGGLGAGTRGAVVMFLTRNGYLTAPGPQAIFTLNASASKLVVTNLPIGPPNVIARVIAFTGAGGATQTGGGGFYFWIPAPVKTIDNGQTVTYDATIINDNVTTQVTLNITDAVLLAGLSISDQGTNNFAQIELGSCLGLIAYASRLFAWGEQNKIQNLLNFSFDGGIGQTVGSTVTTYPLGWTVDQNYGAGGSVTVSPLFGDAYSIDNTTVSTQATYGMITQPAYQDQFGVPIIETNTAYSIRVTASASAASGNLVVDLYSPSTTQIWGNFTIPLASLTSGMQILSGTLLTTPFTIVPNDLLIRIYATEIPAGGTVLIDRIEPFPTLAPVLTTQMRASYFDNFEAFDQVTGNLGVGTQNQQPIMNAFSIFDNLYVVKSSSLYSTVDNGVTEPDGWSVREVSNKVGTPSIHGVDVGEGWALVAGLAGLYIFTGGDPIKISPEIDPLWQMINWQYGKTIWLRNDTNTRRIFVGVPIPTPNQWMPTFPVNANPTQPNVVLMCNYKELMTSGALASEGPVRITYMGDLKTFALGRKWSAWSIEACYADFITRQNATEPLFFCGDAAPKIYQQIAGNYADDGEPMHCQYVTYGFPKSQEAQALQLGYHELIAEYSSMLVNGSGNLVTTVYPDTLGSPDAETQGDLALGNPSPGGDLELPLNIVGNRFFIGLQVLLPFEWYEISRIVLALKQNPWAPLRGTNVFAQ